YEFPATRFVADFIGSVNLFDARVTAAGAANSGTTLQCAELSMPLQVDASVAAGAGAAVWVALRPGKITLSRGAPGQQSKLARGLVREIAYLGDLSVFLVRLESGPQG